MPKQISVAEFLNILDHPFKEEILELRKIIQSISPEITEDIKWGGPTFSYKGYIVTFNLHYNDKLLLVFHNGAIIPINDHSWEGSYPDRRLVYIRSMEELKAKQPLIEDAIKEWIKIMDKKTF